MNKKNTETLNKWIIKFDRTSQEQMTSRYVGKKYNLLTVTKILGKRNKDPVARALCDCGKTTIFRLHDAKRGRIKSCGCYRSEANRINKRRKIHGMSNTAQYDAWSSLKCRLDREKKSPGFCDRWKEPNKGYTNFLDDMGERPDGPCGISRIDKNKEYSKENCVWIKKCSRKK